MKVYQTNSSTRRPLVCSMLLLVHLLALAACSQNLPLLHTQTDNASNKLKESVATSKSPQESIQTLVLSLISPEELVRNAAASKLLKTAQASPDERNAVIKEIMASVAQKPELDGTHTVLSPVIFEYWRSVTMILMELKASEAIDAMVACIQCSNGYSGTMGEPPASYALVRMGGIAIPKLSHALLNEPNGYKRIKIVLCLSRIGGPQAKSALKKALSSESDKTVREYIKSALR